MKVSGRRESSPHENGDLLLLGPACFVKTYRIKVTVICQIDRCFRYVLSQFQKLFAVVVSVCCFAVHNPCNPW